MLGHVTLPFDGLSRPTGEGGCPQPRLSSARSTRRYGEHGRERTVQPHERARRAGGRGRALARPADRGSGPRATAPGRGLEEPAGPANDGRRARALRPQAPLSPAHSLVAERPAGNEPAACRLAGRSPRNGTPGSRRLSLHALVAGHCGRIACRGDRARGTGQNPFWANGPWWQLVFFYLLGFGGTIMGCVARGAGRGLPGILRGVLVAQVYAFYSWLLWPVLLRAAVRQLARRRDWAKTQREALA
jgi:hypothetical protein